MTAFRYRAASRDGRIAEGVLQLATDADVRAELQRRSLYAIEIEPARRASSRTWWPTSMASDRVVWSRTVATLVTAGLPLDQVLSSAARDCRHPAMRTAATAVHQAVRNGAALSVALARQPEFGATLAAAASAGETSGSLGETLERAATSLEELHRLRSEVLSALVYPALLLASIVTGVSVLLINVLPRFAGMLADLGTRPAMSTRILLAASGFAARWWWSTGLLVIAVVIGARGPMRQPRWQRRWHRLRLQLPLMGPLEQRWHAASLLRSLALLLESGTPLVPALRVTGAAIPNLELRARLDAARDEIARGGRLAVALTDIVPSQAARLIAAGESSGRLPSLAAHAAVAMDAELRRALRLAVALIEPAAILLLGGVVAFIALAMIQAIYAVNAAAL